MEYKNDKQIINIFESIKRIQALAEIGLEFNKTAYDRERYNEIQEICLNVLSGITEINAEKIKLSIIENNGYKTPKVDVRAVVFNDNNEILLIQEKADGLWSLPGGWADVGYSPSEVAVKECFEEAGLKVKPRKLIAILDKTKQKMPPEFEYVYKIFIDCIPLETAISAGEEASDAKWFRCDNIPELSLPRINKEQIEMVFRFRNNEFIHAVFD